MNKFKTGMKVVRIVEWTCSNPHWKGQPIQKGQIVTVQDFHIAYGDEVLNFLEITNPVNAIGKEFGYLADEFEPLIETATGFVEMTYTKIIEQIPMGQS